MDNMTNGNIIEKQYPVCPVMKGEWKEANHDRWLTVYETMQKLQISRSTLRRWTAQGYLREHRFGNSHTIYYLESEIDLFLRQSDKMYR